MAHLLTDLLLTLFTVSESYCMKTTASRGKIQQEHTSLGAKPPNLRFSCHLYKDIGLVKKFDI